MKIISGAEFLSRKFNFIDIEYCIVIFNVRFTIYISFIKGHTWIIKVLFFIDLRQLSPKFLKTFVDMESNEVIEQGRGRGGRRRWDRGVSSWKEWLNIKSELNMKNLLFYEPGKLINVDS